MVLASFAERFRSPRLCARARLAGEVVWVLVAAVAVALGAGVPQI